MTPLDLISLADAKAYLKVDFADEDALITSLIKSAIEQIERKTEQRLYQRSETISTARYTEVIHLYPVNEITSIMIGDDALVLDTDYEISGNDRNIYDFYTDDLKVITLDVGYEAGQCPESLKQACFNLIEYYYNNRGAADMPGNVQQLISTFDKDPW